MSILSRLKNKLQDPALNETKMREFDDCMSLLKNENVELHKRIDQLEALYKANINTQQTHSLEEHIRELEQENRRLFTENQCQREEYQRFLDQITTMVLRTAAMQENVRQECASIYHVIERLIDSTNNAIQINQPFDVIKEAKRRILNRSCENSSKISNELIPSSSSSSLITHCSLSTSKSGSLNLPIKKKDTKPQVSILNDLIEEKQEVLQRSETFLISKIPHEELSSSTSMIKNDRNVHQRPITRPMGATTSTPVRPSRLPSRCTNSKTQPSNNVDSTRSVASKLPIRITNSLNRQQTPIKKSNIPTPVVSKTKKDSPIVPNRSIPSANPSTTKKTIPPSDKTRSHLITTTEKNHIPSPLNKCPRTPIDNLIEQIKSTSSESSIEERQQQHMNKLLPIVQDEGYSTWSSIDVKHDVIRNNNTGNNETDDREKNIRFVKTWLDTAHRQCATKPVKEVQIDQLDEFSDDPSFLCPFVRNRCSNFIPISLPPRAISFSNKDLSIDSLDSSQSKDQTMTSSFSSSSTSSSSSTFSRSETFEKLLTAQTLSNISDDLTDSTCSTSSTFNMSEYIEDHFIDQDDNSSENSSLFESTIINKNLPLKPQKRLLFPGLLNRLIFVRRILSDSDLQRKECHLNENENQAYVYHSNIINEHSVEVNLINTYGSETELHVWSHDCAEQRRFLDERQQEKIEEHQSNSDQQLAIERQILLQQIYEYPWLLQENDLDRTTKFSSSNIISPLSDLIVPSHNPDFYQLCALTNSSSFVISYDPNTRHHTPPTASSVL